MQQVGAERARIEGGRDRGDGGSLLRMPELAAIRNDGWNRLRVRRSGSALKVSANDAEEVSVELPRGRLEFGFLPPTVPVQISSIFLR